MNLIYHNESGPDRALKPTGPCARAFALSLVLFLLATTGAGAQALPPGGLRPSATGTPPVAQSRPPSGAPARTTEALSPAEKPAGVPASAALPPAAPAAAGEAGEVDRAQVDPGQVDPIPVDPVPVDHGAAPRPATVSHAAAGAADASVSSPGSAPAAAAEPSGLSGSADPLVERLSALARTKLELDQLLELVKTVQQLRDSGVAVTADVLPHDLVRQLGGTPASAGAGGAGAPGTGQDGSVPGAQPAGTASASGDMVPALEAAPPGQVLSIRGAGGRLTAEVETPAGVRLVRLKDRLGEWTVSAIDLGGVALSASGGRSLQLPFSSRYAK
ncbi:hypothetical protein [Tistlia consotensis]|nr:hypothetical protein [Tistlia consotensis]